jgi:hypothetical protein
LSCGPGETKENAWFHWIKILQVTQIIMHPGYVYGYWVSGSAHCRVGCAHQKTEQSDTTSFHYSLFNAINLIQTTSVFYHEVIPLKVKGKFGGMSCPNNVKPEYEITYKKHI